MAAYVRGERCGHLRCETVAAVMCETLPYQRSPGGTDSHDRCGHSYVLIVKRSTIVGVDKVDLRPSILLLARPKAFGARGVLFHSGGYIVRIAVSRSMTL